jgi:S1-C subfamily serine protease
MIGMATEPFVSADEKSVTIAHAMDVFDVTVIAADPSTDVAILKAETTPSKLTSNSQPQVFGVRSSTPQSNLSAVGASLETGFPEPGSEMLLAGYPLGENVFILQTGISTGLDFFRGREQYGPPADQLRIMLSLVSNAGNSGGPVFDNKGKVVGLLEGNEPAPIRDQNGDQIMVMRQQRDASGNLMFDDNRKPILELVPGNENSGISLAVPAKFIGRLALKKNISLE